MSIPNLSALVALQRLSETGSISATANAMSLTQSAISHKLKALESQLGFPLLTREGRGVRLTRRAQHYVGEVAPALGRILTAGETGLAEGHLSLNIAPGFATGWLIPRLARFSEAHPKLTIRLTSPRGYGDLGAMEDDIYVAFLSDGQAPAQAQRLMGISFFPVAAPTLLKGELRQDAAELMAFQLLHLSGRSDWRGWFRGAGVSEPIPAGGLEFDDIQVMNTATQAGLGLSLGDSLTCRAALERGQLIQAHPHAMVSERAYWLLDGKSPDSRAKAAFRSWIIAEAAESGA